MPSQCGIVGGSYPTIAGIYIWVEIELLYKGTTAIAKSCQVVPSHAKATPNATHSISLALSANVISWFRQSYRSWPGWLRSYAFWAIPWGLDNGWMVIIVPTWKNKKVFICFLPRGMDRKVSAHSNTEPSSSFHLYVISVWFQKFFQFLLLRVRWWLFALFLLRLLELPIMLLKSPWQTMALRLSLSSRAIPCLMIMRLKIWW